MLSVKRYTSFRDRNPALFVSGGRMATCSTNNCPNELSPNSKMRTCPNCRAYWHRWDRKRPAEVVHYAHKLRLYQSRMNVIAVVKDDELHRVDHALLVEKKLLTFPIRQAKQRAKSSVVAFKLRDRKRKSNG